jgi:hypothetical protein
MLLIWQLSSMLGKELTLPLTPLLLPPVLLRLILDLAVVGMVLLPEAIPSRPLLTLPLPLRPIPRLLALMLDPASGRVLAQRLELRPFPRLYMVLEQRGIPLRLGVAPLLLPL